MKYLNLSVFVLLVFMLGANMEHYLHIVKSDNKVTAILFGIVAILKIIASFLDESSKK